MCMQFCLCWANIIINTPSTSFFSVSIPSACLSQLVTLVLLSTVSFLNFFLCLYHLTSLLKTQKIWQLNVCETAMIVMEAALLTGVVTGSLTIYTFWAVKRGSDFSFLGPFLFASLMVMLLFSIIQVNINFHHQQHCYLFLFLFALTQWSRFVGYYRCFSR